MSLTVSSSSPNIQSLDTTPPATDSSLTVQSRGTASLRRTQYTIQNYFRPSEARFIQMEKILDGVDLVPMISNLSGAIRFFVGALQAIWYAAKAALNMIASLFSANQTERRAYAAYEFELLKHGLTNVFKGAVAIIFSLAYNIYCWVNLYHLKQRFAYPSEQLNQTPSSQNFIFPYTAPRA